jgi:hypothetical protein
MKITSIYFCLLFILAKPTIAQQCTFEKIYPYKASKYDLVYKTKNNDFICLTNDCVDTTDYTNCADGSFINRLLRIDSCGMVKWDKRINLTYGSISNDGICESDSENIMLVGTYGGLLSGLFIIKLSKEGEILYEKRFLNTPIGTTIYFNSNNSIIKLSNKNLLVYGNRSRYEGQPSVPFILEIDENGNIIRYQEFRQTFKVNKIYYTTSFKLIDDTSYFLILETGYEHNDTSYRYTPDTTFTITKNNYRDIVVAFLDTALNVTDWYSITSLVGDSIRPHIDRHAEIRPVNDTVMYITGELFKDHKTSPPTNRPLRAAAMLSVRERKIISRELYAIGEPIPYPICFRKDMFSLYNKAIDSSFIIKDKYFNVIKTIKTSTPQKFHVYPETPGFPTTNTLSTAYLTDDYSIIALGSSTFRKIKLSTEDSIFTRSEFAHEFYIIKIDSNGNFTPTTWNSIKVQKENNLIINIFPNPTDNKINIKLPKSFYNIEIFDIKGNLMKSYNHIDNEVQIETGSLVEGLYLLKATDITYGNTHTQKFIVRRH